LTQKKNAAYLRGLMTFVMTLSLSRGRSKASHETNQAAQNNRKKWRFLINIWLSRNGILILGVGLAGMVYINVEGVGSFSSAPTSSVFFDY